LSTEPLPPDYYERHRPTHRRRNWKRIAAWIVGGLLVLAAVFLIGVEALLHNDAFRQHLLRIAQTKLNETTGVQLKMRDFSVHLSGVSPAVDMYDVVIDSAPPYQATPLLKVDRLSVGIQIVSLLQRKWYLKDIVIDHPVARVFVGENGETNLPTLKGSDQRTSVFDLGVRHVTLGQGEVYYNDKKSALDADLHNLEFRSTFDLSPKRYSGELSYKNGLIHFQNLDPMMHSLEAEFEATPDGFILKRSLLKSGASQFSLTARIDDYGHPKVNAEYQSSLDTGELRQLLKDYALVGVLKLAGSAKFENVPNKPVLQTLSVEGNLTSSGVQVHTGTVHTLVRDISVRYLLQNGNAEVRDFRAALLGGGVKGTLKIKDITGAQVADLNASLHNVPLAGIQALVNAQAMRDFRMTGTANAKLDAKWHKTLETLTARMDATVAGGLSQLHADRSPANVPITADVHAGYSAAAQTVTFTPSHIESGQTTIDLSGTVSRTSALQVQVQSNDLSEIESIANAFAASPQQLNLGGTASFMGTVRGSTTDPQIAGQLSATSLKVKGTEWRTVRTSIDASPSHLGLRNGDITPGNGRGRIAFNVNAELDQWAFRDTHSFQVDLNASQLNLSDLKNLSGFEAPVTGTLSANVSLHGSQLNPIGRGTVTLTEATVADESIQSANADFEGTGEEIRVRLGLKMPAGNPQTKFTYFPKRKIFEGELQANGIRLDQLRALRARNLNLTGTLNLNAKGSGTFDDPGLEVTAQIPRLQIQNETINTITLQAKIAQHVATATLDSQSGTLSTFVRGRGRVNLTGDYETDAAFDTSRISLQPLVALYLPAQSANLMGQTEIHGTVRGPLKDMTRLDAHITVPTLSVSYTNNIQLAAAQPIQLDYSRGVLTLQRTAIKGTGTDLQLQGTIPVEGTAPVSILALGTVDLGIARIFSPDVTSSGQLQFNIDGTGRSSNPNIQGQIKIVNAAFAGDDVPVTFQNGNGVLTLTNSRLEIDRFEGNISGGKLTATGGLTYRPSIQFNLAVTGNGIRTLYPAGVREGLDTNLTLVGSTKSAVLRGQVRLTELSFSPTFDFNDIASVADATAGSTAPPGSLAQNIGLDINVVSASDLNLASSKLSLQGAMNLRVRGTAANPAVTGRMNVSGGELFFRGNRYILEPSTIVFVDPYKIEPRLNLSVNTKVNDYDIRMLFRGTLERLRTTYTSEPSLPPSDIINLLVFGKTTEAQAANPTPVNIGGAQSLIASSVSNQITNQIEKVAGISQLSIDPVLGGNQADPGARITIKQRVSGNVFVTLATDATSTQRQVIKLEYQATPRVAISGVRDQNGGMAFDVRVHKTW
jgi:translocation and assembly module TamB